jgi:predicted acylesterase/phospholipase RssA
MSAVNIPEPPLGEIAISLSGGGYRAAAFHLGVFDLLQRLDLLKDVRVLSTVSGGTFTGMLYGVSVVENDAFEVFYDKLYAFLRDTHVIRLALADLSRKDSRDESMPSLIKSAARVYASEKMLGDRRLGPLMDDAAKQFRGLVFNSVEFRNGNSFRFQTSAGGRAVIGNGNLRVDNVIARDIRLADIAAASSCFPSGFEPLRFPDDFQWPATQSLASVRQALGASFAEPVALMDGGIYDNQGIDSVEQVYRRADEDDVDNPGLFIISDTSQRHDNLFSFPAKNRAGWLSLRGVVGAAWLLFILALVASISLLVNLLEAMQTNNLGLLRAVFLFIIPLIFCLSIVVALPWTRRRLQGALVTVQEKTDLELWPYVKRLTIPELLELIDGRLKSLIVLTSSVFMKRVRDLGFKDINVYERYRGKLSSNLIYSLNDETRFGAAIRTHNLEPTAELQSIAIDAEAVPTNLWFTEEATLQKLIVCGQASICFNLMKYMLEQKSADLQDPNSRVSQVYANALKFWDILKAQPHELLRAPRSDC